MIRVVSFEAMLGQISVETAILEFKWNRPLSNQILSSGHLMMAALKMDLVACGLIYALSSVSGLTAVAFTGNALPTQIGLCRKFAKDVWISRDLAVSGCQSFWDPTISSTTAVSATSIKIASTSGTVISRSIVSKIVTCLQQAVVVRGLIYTISQPFAGLAISRSRGSFIPDGLYDSSWDGVTPMTGKDTTNCFNFKSEFGRAC